MPRVDIPITGLDRTGTVNLLLSEVTSDSTNHHSVANDGNVVLAIRSTAGAVNVTFRTATGMDGTTPPTRVVSVAGSAHNLYGPFPSGDYNQPTDQGRMWFDVADTTLRIRAYRWD